MLLDAIAVPSVSLPLSEYCLVAVESNGFPVIFCNRNALSLVLWTQIELPQEAGTRIVSVT